MAKQRDWNKEQPHKANNGQIASREYAKKHPEKVTWVKVD
jgi:hypothetical protein